MDQVYEILIHKVHDYEGTVNEMTGDGIMALFGAPIALEDASQRAIRSALATLLLAQRIGVYEKLIFTKILYFICHKPKNPYEGLLVRALKFVRGG